MDTDISPGLASKRAEEESIRYKPRRVINKVGNNIDSWGPFTLWSDSDDENDYVNNQNNDLARTTSEPATIRDVSSNNMSRTRVPSASNQIESDLQSSRQGLATLPLPKASAQLIYLPRSTYKPESTLTGEQKAPTIALAKNWNHRTRGANFSGASSSTSQGTQLADTKPHNVDYLFNMISNHVKPDSHNDPDFPTHIRNLEDATTRLHMKKETLKGVYLRTFDIDERASIKPRLDSSVKELQRKEMELASVRKAYRAAEDVAYSLQKAVAKAVNEELAAAMADKEQPGALLKQRPSGAYSRDHGWVASAADVGLKTPKPTPVPKPKAMWLAAIPEGDESERRNARHSLGEHEPKQEPEQAPEPVAPREPGRRPSLHWARGKVTHVFHRYFGGRHGDDGAQS
ncbi:hypothetical protein ACKVWC_003268 [Pyricularia oryzae]